MRLCLTALTFPLIFSLANAQSLAHNYESFFGKEDRIDLFGEKASSRFSETVLNSIRENTLLIDCGASGKPSTAFVVKTSNGTRIMSAGHNLKMADVKNLNCRISGAALSKGRTPSLFQDSGTKEDAAYDIAIWPNITTRNGFNICKSIDVTSKLYLIQSWDGTGKLGISPICKLKAVEGPLITTSCKGHYKASGAPLLSASEENVCVVGVFNAHSGKQFNYESYTARLYP